MYNSLELRLPFLDHKLAQYSLRIPAKYKINNDLTKVILRDVAKNLNLQEDFAQRKKKAAQYGSNMNKALKKLTKQSKLKYVSEYLKQFYTTHNLRLGALFSSGKDSTYAIHVMQKQNYKVECLITIKSENTASYMFHTPNINLTKLQAEALKIPLLEQTTKGEKESELKDLETAMKKAKKQYKIEGIITGALYSTYQRDRIEKIADKLNLKIFSPLWHMNQETEMRELVNNNFKIILSSIAAEGLNKSHLGKIIDHKFIDNLAQLNAKVQLNIAGEGGEFESLVLDAPNFHKQLTIKQAKIIMENERTGNFIIEKVKLENK
jgi:diphthine-ammonia ligase